jgi:hypothetical protein
VVESPVWLWSDPVAMTRKLLDEVERRYLVEGGKFHLAGAGAGGAGAFDVAFAMPGRVASVTGLPGCRADASGEELRALTGVRVNLFVGENDGDWLDESKRAHERMSSLGLDAHLEVIEGGERVLEELSGGEFMDRLAARRERPAGSSDEMEEGSS